MKHLAVNDLPAVFSGYRKGLRAMLLLGALWLWQQALPAQCDTRCTHPNMAVPKVVEIDNQCRVTIRARELLVASENCPGNKMLVVRNRIGTIIATANDSITFNASALVNQLLSVTVTDLTTGLFCVNFIIMLDKTAPVIDCQPLEMTCVEYATIVAAALPNVIDNCDDLIQLDYQDEVQGGLCERSIRRTWTARDRSGNESSCVQIITVTRPALSEINFPSDTILTCLAADTSAIALGQPALHGETITAGAICNLVATRTNSLTWRCDSTIYSIWRFWTLTDRCNGEIRRDTQVITLQDTTAPLIRLPERLVVTSDAGQCYDTVNLPHPELSDNCDANPRFFISTSYGAVGAGPHPFLPVGAHTVQYKSVDACSNSIVARMQLVVVDEQAPSAICERYTAVALPTVGIVTVPARTFNKGSRDNCVSTLYFKVRKLNTGSCEGINGDDSPLEGYQEWFDDQITFCCNETGSDYVKVILRVYETNPGAGPINPNRELSGGDLYGRYNECVIDVEVQDQLPPIIKCPADITIHCNDLNCSAARFGSPTVEETCGCTLDSTVVESFNDCGVGFIARTFTAKDKFGNQSACTQRITIVNPTPLKMEDIRWPQPYSTGVCGAKTDVDKLPPGFNRPVVENTSCNFVALSHRDQFFDIAFLACYKIIRTWEVIDWCNYDPQFPERGGRFAYNQTIKIEDNEAPTLNCPTDITVSTGNSCGLVSVVIPAVTAQDCNTNVLISNDSPYAASNGADASGNYPVGITTVTFTARDRCGNTATCRVRVTVEDRTNPSPVCIVGLSVNLAEKDGKIQASIPAKAFDGGSFDNCTPCEKLKLTLRRPGPNTTGVPTDTALTFGCNDLGNQVVELWATDERGNSSYCVTFIAVLDNSRICPRPASSTIAGGIETERGDFVQNVHVRVNSNTYQVITGANGKFEFPYLPVGGDYTLVPEKNDDLKNGVSTLDILQINKHVLGVQPLNSPYKIIAADVDRSGDITLLDVIRLRRLILGVDEQLPNGNKSWRFVKADFKFPDPTNPFQSGFPESYNINNFDGIIMEADFIAVKIGDVDFSARANNATTAEARASRKVLFFNAEDAKLKAGETTTVEIKTPNARQMLGYQCALQFDPEALEFVRLEHGVLPNMNEANFGLHLIDEGVVTASWNAANTVAVADTATVLYLTMRARQEVQLREALRLSPRYLPGEAYTTDEAVWDLKLEFSQPQSAFPRPGIIVESNFELYQNAPNPFATHTIVPFRLPETTYARLTIFDQSGRVVYSREGQFLQGYNEVTINRAEVQAQGTLYYRLETLGQHQTKKMILLD